MKECSKCGKTKNTTEFSKCNRNKDGLQYHCRQCNKVSNKLFRQLNPNFQFTDINYGIKTTIQWFNENYSNIRK